jgi:hypothetical protein
MKFIIKPRGASVAPLHWVYDVSLIFEIFNRFQLGQFIIGK